MSIEQDIQQSRFRSPYEKLIVNIMFTHSWLTDIHAKMLKPFGVSREQYNVLRILRGQYPKPATVNLIMERMIDKMSNASRLVDKLVAKQLVDRRVCPNDRRAVDVIITQEGLDLLSKMDGMLLKIEEQFSSISEEEANQLSDLLDKLRK